MIPRRLDEWNLDIIKNLLAKGYYESEFFDFKERLPHKNDCSGKDRLTKACCAFANSNGGFLIFGISDDRSLSEEGRLLGLDRHIDFPEHFGNYPKQCMPNMDWDFKNPSLELENGNRIHIVWIPKSWEGPHCYSQGNSGLCFPKRTNQGDMAMDYNEIRISFLGYYEKYYKLRLLAAELQNLKILADEKVNTGSPYRLNFQTQNLIFPYFNLFCRNAT